MVTAEDVKIGKPAPDMFLQAAERLGVAPEKCLALEDAPAGIMAAQAAGMEVRGGAGAAGCRLGECWNQRPRCEIGLAIRVLPC